LDQWFVTNLSLSGFSLVPLFGGGGFLGPITFQHVLDGRVESDFTGSMALAGMAVGASEGIPSLNNSTIARTILKFFADNGGLSFRNAPSATAGICFPNTYKVSHLQSSDFLGDCATILVSGNAGPWANGLYILIFGLPIGFWSWKSTYALTACGLIGADVLYHCTGAAVISGLGAGLSGSLGVAAYGMYGRII
jgi:hypothetical protein